jgi:TPR repeat protein
VLRLREARRLFDPAPEGEGVKNAEAVKWYRKAAAQGLAKAKAKFRKQGK